MVKIDPTISKAMKIVRSKRTDYSTSGFKNPEVGEKARAKSLATRKAKSKPKNV